jgi:hypothetical protein
MDRRRHICVTFPFQPMSLRECCRHAGWLLKGLARSAESVETQLEQIRIRQVGATPRKHEELLVVPLL